MSDEEGRTDREREFSRRVGSQEVRKLRARKRGHNGILMGFAAFGLIGWSVAVPTLVGAAMGIWLDGRHPAHFSWTLLLLGAGLGVGCMNAWHWVQREHRAIQKEEEGDKDE